MGPEAVISRGKFSPQLSIYFRPFIGVIAPMVSLDLGPTLYELFWRGSNFLNEEVKAYIC